VFSHLLALIERWRSRRHCQDMPPASAQDDINLAALRLLDDLARRMETTASSSAAKETIRQYQHISPENLLKDLPHIYLWVEQAISTQDTLEIIRSEVRDVHPALMDLSHFALIFEDNAQQEIVLSVQYITLTVDETYTMIGETQDNILLTLKAWIQTLPDRATLPIPYSSQTSLPETTDDWLVLLRAVSLQFYAEMSSLLGEQVVQRFFERAYQEMAYSYSLLNTYPVVVQMMPDHILDQAKISLLNRRQVEQVLLDKLYALQKSHKELSHQNIELEQASNELIEARTAAVESMTQLKAVIDTVGEGILPSIPVVGLPWSIGKSFLYGTTLMNRNLSGRTSVY
jgi:hypothetical protein